MRALVLALTLAIGPQLNPIEGEHIDADDRDVLPAARHLGDVVDMWMPHIVNLASGGGGGIDLFDPVAVSAHGWGGSQLTFAWGDVDISDPARPGEPLLNMPHAAWDRLAFVSLWAPHPGFIWYSDPVRAVHADAAPPTLEVTRLSLTGAWGGAVGGGLWLPAHFMDREPAYAFGAPLERRQLKSARELVAQLATPTPWGALSLFVERLEHDHHYLTQAVPDLAERNTVLATAHVTALRWPVDVRLAFQDSHRNHEGAQYRWPQPMTRRTYGQAWLVQAQTQRNVTEGLLTLAWGWGYRQDASHLQALQPWLTDVADEWLWMRRPTLPGVLQRWQSNVRARLVVGPAVAPLALELRGQVAQVTHAPDLVRGRFGTTYAGQAATQTQLQIHGPEQAWLQAWRLGADWHGPWERVALAVNLGVDLSAVVVAEGVDFVRWGPAAGVAVTVPTRIGQWFALLRREPEALTAQVARFIDGNTPESTKTTWEDRNGDGIAQADEAGTLLRHGGGPWHSLAPHVGRPSSNHLAVGYRTPWVGPWQFVLSGVGRWTQNRLTVDVPTAAGQAAVPFHDPGGDGRGETRLPNGGQNLTVYAEDPRQTADLGFELTNAKKLSYYLGIETGLVSDARRWWFVNIGGTAYLSAGTAPFGNFADRNDPGAISEASAGRNNQLNAFSRYEHDRAFSLKILAGLRPLPGLSFAVAARYRDGEPMARIVVVPDLPQGPTPIMAIRRGRARDTFHMNWDVRVRYKMAVVASMHATLVCDVYNVFGSATELLEDVRTGPSYRRSVEAIPGRAVFVSFELGV